LEQEAVADDVERHPVVDERLARIAEHAPRRERQVRRDESGIEIGRAAHQAQGLLTLTGTRRDEAAPEEQASLVWERGQVSAALVRHPSFEIGVVGGPDSCGATTAGATGSARSGASVASVVVAAGVVTVRTGRSIDRAALRGVDVGAGAAVDSTGCGAGARSRSIGAGMM